VHSCGLRSGWGRADVGDRWWVNARSGPGSVQWMLGQVHYGFRAWVRHGVGRVRAGGGTGHVTRMIIVDTEFAIYDLDGRKS